MFRLKSEVDDYADKNSACKSLRISHQPGFGPNARTQPTSFVYWCQLLLTGKAARRFNLIASIPPSKIIQTLIKARTASIKQGVKSLRSVGDMGPHPANNISTWSPPAAN